MKKILTIFILIVATMLTTSCQKELPDAIKNVDVSQGDQKNVDVNQGGQTPTPTPTPDNPTNQGDTPTEEDNPWPNY